MSTIHMAQNCPDTHNTTSTITEKGFCVFEILSRWPDVLLQFAVLGLGIVSYSAGLCTENAPLLYTAAGFYGISTVITALHTLNSMRYFVVSKHRSFEDLERIAWRWIGILIRLLGVVLPTLLAQSKKAANSIQNAPQYYLSSHRTAAGPPQQLQGYGMAT